MKKLSMRLFCVLIIILSMIFTTISASALNDEQLCEKLHSEIYYCINLDDDTVVFSKDETKLVAPAGFVKVIAAIVALEQWSDLNESVTVTQESLSLINYDYGVATAGIEVGDTLTRSELLDWLLIASTNDSLSIIAHEIAGSVDGFLKMMQDLVTRIGCENTTLKNIHGFDTEGQFTTALDIAKIMKFGMVYPFFTQSLSQTKLITGETSEGMQTFVSSSNKMKNPAIGDYYHSAVTIGKQTSTEDAGQSIAVCSSQDGYNYLTIVMKGDLVNIDDDEENENTCMTDARQILEWVYANLRFKVVAEENQVVELIEVVSGKGEEKLVLIPEKEITALVPSNTTSNSVLIQPNPDTLPSSIKAPIKAGDVICDAAILYAGEQIAKINLVASKTVELSLTKLAAEKLANFVGSIGFLLFTLVCLIAVVSYLIFTILKIRQKVLAFENSQKKTKKETVSTKSK